MYAPLTKEKMSALELLFLCLIAYQPSRVTWGQMAQSTGVVEYTDCISVGE